ncbi:hypothetical protein KC363_g387 [Hortaea werneckii]|uniref:Zinc finger Mcm10/DnaG-type domain-containing protein n=1 Tax=Hortaea werneckii TaxID=91943 RepID=A0A3M7G3A2_HORWE|nr:hypothetical protein KC361_g600 [Hortaea werneckii]KAI6879306.1 hypothetical protein KC325_g8045 [Hortaea werneckii]KAI6987243.1 hypothetical protein KC359_g8385 [Hortaea werneckii]KAI7141363.1 hypothetical protein KC344_g8054 [Hortaea werneckii]KAI7180072.1 hypothetical protein KC360_g474 [Hortaea werneckii]
MVIVRESPRSKVSPDKPQSQAQWPPKSPFQALLSSPSGRKRWQDRRGQARDRSLSPSPIKSSSRKLQAVAMPSDDEMDMGGGADDDEEDDDDEETLRLKMEAIQARLKLKALQKKKKAEAGAGAGTGAGAGRERTRSRASRDTTPPPSRGHRPSASQPDLYRAPNVEVEVSPIKDHHEDPLLSPARRRLGLNSVPDASGISLKRARDGTVTQQIKRSESALAPPSARRSRDASPPKKKTKSFTERLQASRDQVEEREAKFDRMERTRSKGFSSDVSRQTPFQSTKQKLEGASGGNAGTPSEAKRPSSARDGASSTTMPRSTVRGSQPSEPSSAYKSTPARFSAQANSRATSSKRNDAARPTSRGQQQQRLHTSADSDSDLSISGAPDSHRPTSAGRADHDNSKDESNSSYDPFSELHLSKRNIPHPVVAREMNGKEIYPLPRLLKEVKAPHYEPPDCAEDFVVFGILASKSSPYDQKPQHKTTSSTSGGGGTSQEDPLPPPTAAEEALPRNKFMVLHLTDLRWEMDCFLFGTAFDQFWKLVPGTLLAILNPAILPPKKPNTDTGRFSLKLGSSDDCIMEVGSARDLGFCTATRKDGRECGGWVDRRRTEVCEFHLNAFVERQRKGRMEVNTMWRGQGNDGGNASAGWMKNGNVQSQAREAGGWNRDMQRRRGGGGGGMQSHHREYGTLYSVPPGSGGNGTGDSAASLLDAEDKLQLDSYEAGEASRKRIAAAQRERDLQRRLGAMGKGVGAEYMQASLEGAGTPATEKGKGSDPPSSYQQQQQQQHFEKPSAAELGLLGKQADAAHLSPAKDRRRHFGLGAAGMTNSATTSTTGRQGTGLGWGGARKAGLLLEQQQQQQRGQSHENEINDDAGRNPPPPSAVRRRRSTHDETANGSPNKKRARFMLEDKGLREPGRDSGANELFRIGRNGGSRGGKGRAAGNHEDDDDDDDDDGLEIV